MAKKPKLDLDERMIVVGAFRYYLGRMTISVSAFCDWLVKHWPSLDEGTQAIISREIEDAFRIDDEQRARGEAFCSRLGMDCDRSSWARVRSLYRTPTCCMCGKALDATVPHKLHLDGERSCDECAPPNCEVCEKPFRLAEQIIPNKQTRRARHPGCALSSN